MKSVSVFVLSSSDRAGLFSNIHRYAELIVDFMGAFFSFLQVFFLQKVMTKKSMKAKAEIRPLSPSFFLIVYVLGAPPSVASGSLSTVYLLPLRYITGTPGILRTRRRRSRSHVATM